MKLLIINGSHRPGNTDLIIAKMISALSLQNAEVRELRLREIDMKLPDGCETCAEGGICPNVHDQFSEEIEPTIREYDGYVIATPTWSDGVTPLTKIFWDRIVSWCSEDRMYLKNKVLAIVTHGMAGEDSWNNIISWVKSVCIWEQAKYGGSLTMKSGSKVGDIEFDQKKVDEFVQGLLQ